MHAIAKIRRSRTARSTFDKKSSFKEPWPSPHESVGRFITNIGNQKCWEATGSARDAFQTIGKEIKDYLDEYSEPIPKWVTWSMYMVGHTPEAAVPTIIFCCEEETHRKVIRNTIKDSSILADYPGIVLKHLPRAPDYNQLVQLAGQESTVTSSRPQGSPVASALREVFCSASPIAPGSQLFVKLSGCSSSVRHATAGGLLQIGGSHYLMTAAHAFADRPEPSSSSVTDEELYFTDSDDDDDDVEATSKGSIVPPPTTISADSYPSLSTRGSSFNLEHSPTKSTQPLETEYTRQESFPLRQFPKTSLPTGSSKSHPQATNPASKVAGGGALDAPLNAFPIGRPFISSIDGLHAELDYALIEVTDAFLLDKGHAWIPSSYMAAISHHAKKKPGNGPNLDIISFTASSGLVTGSRSITPTFMRSPYGKAFQEVYTVSFNSTLSKGDCGSWVIDPRSGKLIGHLVAGSPDTGFGYIVPADHVLEDLQKRLGRTPILCLGKDQCSAGSQTAVPPPRQATLANNSTPVEQVNVSLAKVLTLQFKTVLKQKRMRSLKALREQAKQLSGPRASYLDELPSYSSLQSLPIFPTAPASGPSLKFRNVLTSLSSVPLRWENPGLLDEALSVVPLEWIYGEAETECQTFAAEAESLETGLKPAWGYQDCVVRALLQWFKDAFFSWVNNPSCGSCSGPTIVVGMAKPLPDEIARGAKHVELYKCSLELCGKYERFPRYNDPFVLLQTRRGRVGEWANCFGMLCRAVGCRVRWVWNAEDQVWIEVFSEHRHRWVHVDPCEKAWDKPRLYTEGWDKKLSYCMAFSREGVADVTRRYVRSSRYALDRTRCTEAELLGILEYVNGLRRSKLSQDERLQLHREAARESHELTRYMISDITSAVCKLRLETLENGSVRIARGDRRKTIEGPPQANETEPPRYVR